MRLFSSLLRLASPFLIAGALSTSAFAQTNTAKDTAHPFADCGIDVRPQDLPNGDYGGFYTWPELVSQMETWLKKYPQILKCDSIGTTTLGRKIPLLKISNPKKASANKPQILYLVGLHPREQAPTVAIVRFVDELLSQYGKDKEITRLVDTHEIYVIPMANVDGKIYDFQHGNGTTRGGDWRKNRRDNGDGTFGVDLNRNFPARWGGNRALDKSWGTSTTDTKGNIYEGPAPVSEPEVQAIMKFIMAHPLRVMLDLHSPLHDMRAPGFLSVSEQPIFLNLLQQMQKTQKSPYALQIGKPGGEPTTDTRSGDSGISYPWAYYTTGAYSFNIEMGYQATEKTGKPYEKGLRARYAVAKGVETEYLDNIRGPLFTLLRSCDDLKPISQGSAKLIKSEWIGEPKAGQKIIWKPQIKGDFDYAVAMSGNAAGTIGLEYRKFPATAGYPIQIQPDAKVGTRIPLTLYVWEKGRKRSILTTTLVVE